MEIRKQLCKGIEGKLTRMGKATAGIRGMGRYFAHFSLFNVSLRREKVDGCVMSLLGCKLSYIIVTLLVRK